MCHGNNVPSELLNTDRVTDPKTHKVTTPDNRIITVFNHEQEHVKIIQDEYNKAAKALNKLAGIWICECQKEICNYAESIKQYMIATIELQNAIHDYDDYRGKNISAAIPKFYKAVLNNIKADTALLKCQGVKEPDPRLQELKNRLKVLKESIRNAINKKK